MNVIFPIIELVDRYSIAKLKFDKTKANQGELEFYRQQLENYNIQPIEQELNELYQIHFQIWALEAELKSGAEEKLPLAEIGRRAIEIRNWNNKRISLKNHIAEKLGQGHIREIKCDHLSQGTA